MRDDPVTMAEQSKLDWKGIGYLFSIAGVLLLGARSMPRPTDPKWFWWALIGGIVTSIIGFGLRYFAHLKQRREIRRTEAKAGGKAAH
jgi:drug/metabolite transporter (DMT)-like permease